MRNFRLIPAALAWSLLLSGTLHAVDTDKIIPVADGSQNRWYHYGGAKSPTLHAEYAEGLGNGRRIVMKFDLRGISQSQIRGAVLRVSGGISYSSNVDVRVYRYSNNNWDESGDSSIPFPSDHQCTFLTRKHITSTTPYPGGWIEFDIGENLGALGADGFLSLVIRNFDTTYASSFWCISRNTRIWDGTLGHEPYLIFRTWTDSGVADGGFPDGDLGKWQTTPGTGSVSIVENPYQPEGYLAELITSSSVALWQDLDTPKDPFVVSFRHEFRSGTGDLNVWLADRDGNNTLLGTIPSPEEATGSMTTARLPVTDPDLLYLDHARLSFVVDGPAGTTVWLDDIAFVGTGDPDQLPHLRMERMPGGMMRLSWPDPSDGYRLQHSPDLSAGSWEDVSEEPVIELEEKHVTLPILGPNGFFRLARP